MGIQTLISFDVADVDRVEAVFKARQAAREEAGITAAIYRQIDAPSTVWVIADAPSKEAFVAFFSSAEQQEAMKNGGVISTPTVTMLESI